MSLRGVDVWVGAAGLGRAIDEPRLRPGTFDVACEGDDDGRRAESFAADENPTVERRVERQRALRPGVRHDRSGCVLVGSRHPPATAGPPFRPAEAPCREALSPPPNEVPRE